MDFKNGTPEWSYGAAALAASALLAYAGTGLQPLWWVTWFAPVPVLAFAARTRGSWLAVIVAFLAWILGELNLWTYLSETLSLPLALRLVILGVPALFFAATVWFWRLQIVRGASWRALLAMPCLWVATEHVMSRLSPHGTFGSIAYTQMDCLPVLQLAALGGTQAISFVLFLTASALGILLAPHLVRRDRLCIAGSVGVLLVSICAWGTIRLYSLPSHLKAMSIGLAASSDERFRYPRDSASALKWLGDYADVAATLAQSGSELVVLPEKIAWLTDADAERASLRFRSVALNHHSAILVGWARNEGTRAWNEAVLFKPDGRELRYVKHHLLPGFESEFTAGDSYETTASNGVTLGLAICKDMDFPDISRAYGTRHTTLLLVPAWDFEIDGWLHSRMAVMRGVEGGFMVARASKQGLLTVSDSCGRVIAETQAVGRAFSTLQLQISPSSQATLYRWSGDWLGLACVIASAILVVPAHRSVKRKA